tara:strand:+ start:5793 stop:9443 length:3651 start_codon:yes stop_codon:yes gene_type:complete
MLKSTILSLLFLGFTICAYAQKPTSLLWEISGNGLKEKSYLYGTMHVSNKIAFHLGDSFFIALDQAKKVCLESDPGEWIEEMYYSKDGMLSGRFGSHNSQNGNFYETLTNIEAPNKKDLENALRQKHPLENGFLYRGSEQNKEYEENTYLDLFIYQYAKKNKIEVINLEDYEETNKLQALSLLPDETENTDEESRKKTTRKNYYSKWSKEMTIREAMENAYRNGNLYIIDSITKMTASSKNYLHYFLHERNRIMVEGIDTLAQKHSVFIGIGAAHLPGKKGVIEMLKDRGYSLRPVDRNKSQLAKDRKNSIEKAFLNIPYKPFTTNDGYITANLPSQLYETLGEHGDLQYFLPDMVNGGNFLISRFQTYSPLHQREYNSWKQKLDSLLFENVEGKIIEQKEITVSGFEAIKIMNKTRRGDYQRRLIVFTPLEIIFFKMAGTGTWAKEYGEQFINSIKINHANPDVTHYESHLKDYSIDFPGTAIHTEHALTILNTPPRYDVQSYTENDSAYYLLQSDWLNDFGYIEEDTFELSYLITVFGEQLDSAKKVKVTRVNDRFTEGYVLLNNGDSIYLRTLLHKNFYYVLAAKSEYSKAIRFFNTLKFNSQIEEDEYQVYHDTLLRYTVNTPVVPEKMEDLMRYVRIKTRDDKKEDWDYNKQYRNFFYKKNYESIKVKYLKHSDYYHYETMEKFWEKELEEYLNGNYIIKQETYDENDSTPTAWIVVSDTGSQKVIEVKSIVNKGVVYTIRASYNAKQEKSRFITTFFNSFHPDMDTLMGKTITASNAPLFFADLASKDSSRIKRAIHLSNRISFTKDYADSMIWYADHFEFPENDKKGTANYLVKQLGYLKHPAVLPYLKRKYEESTDDFEAQFAVLKALSKYGTKKSYKILKDLILEEPPITPDEDAVENFFYYLDDSLALTSKLYPKLWDLLLYTDYRSSVYPLGSMLLDSNLVNANSYKKQKALVLRTAKSYSAEKKSKRSYRSSIKLKDTDYSYSFGKKREYAISPIDQFNITAFLKLLMPYYTKDQKVKAYINSLLDHQDKDYQFVATVLLTQYNIPLHDSVYVSLSKNPTYRFAFYKALNFIDKAHYFDSTYLSQKDMMESVILSSSSINVEDSVAFVERRYIKNKYEEGYVYFFKHQSNYNHKWYLHYAGLQPKDSTVINPKTNFDYIERKASVLYSEADIKNEIDDWVKHLNLIGRERAASKSSENGYSFYD